MTTPGDTTLDLKKAQIFTWVTDHDGVGIQISERLDSADDSEPGYSALVTMTIEESLRLLLNLTLTVREATTRAALREVGL
jgi:hypothetical protein